MVTVCVIALIFVSGVVTAAESSAELQSAGALYSKSVDLANEGKYTEALKAADQALALNVTSLIPVIQANRAGILTVVGRYDDALLAANAALATEGNLTTTHSIAWYNKGDALRHLGRSEEAKAAFAQAQALDPTLLPPKDLIVPVTPVSTTAKSPLPWTLAAGALALVFVMGTVYSRGKR
ncbi:MAG: tetratricopeptide repeat protein [Methanoregula sp.]|nr:tetratricopeptide repeat protein [Methanoregula sp.]